MNKTILVSALLLELSMTSSAATINVDGVNCKLADAISSANTDTAVGSCSVGSGADELILPSNSMVTLQEELPTITSEITLQGNNSTLERDLNSDTFRILTVSGGTLHLNDTTISQGDVSHTLGGGGPFNTGGGIQVNTGTLNIARSTISTNQGGGVLFMNANGSITDSVIKDNQGFEVYDYFYGAGVTINCSDVTIDRTTINNNSTSAFPGGAGLIQSGNCDTELVVRNTTISGNVSDSFGGGILTDATDADLILSQVTVTQNICNVISGTGCGMNSFNTNTYVYQSLFSGNKDFTPTAYTNEINTQGSGISLDQYSLIGLNGDSGSNGLTPGYLIPVETDLSAIIDTNLADNGGYTPTHTLNLSGPAVDLIPEITCISLTDQTNKTRPIDAFGSDETKCDVGAFEAPSDIIFKDGFNPTVP